MHLRNYIKIFVKEIPLFDLTILGILKYIVPLYSVEFLNLYDLPLSKKIIFNGKKLYH